ncbi:hypothetical protein Tco_0118011 [Tanacetum coccineum]
MWTYYFSRTTLDVQRSTSDCAKRKVITYEDYDVFEAYSPLCERNVRASTQSPVCANEILRFSADISEDVHDNNVSNTHYLDNEAANGLFVQSGVSPQTPTTLVLRFQTNVRIAEDVSAAAVTPPSLSTRPSVVFLSKGGYRKEAEEGLGRKRVDLRSLCSTSGTFFRQGKIYGSSIVLNRYGNPLNYYSFNYRNPTECRLPSDVIENCLKGFFFFTLKGFRMWSDLSF